MKYLREVEKNDIDLIYEWANDPSVRANSFNSDPIPYENHIKWFDRMMDDDNVLQYILMDEDIAIGQIRLNIEGDEAEIGYSISAEYRGKGYGHLMLQLAAEKVKGEHPEIKTLIAKVKPDNTASNKLFESEGYAVNYICYSLNYEAFQNNGGF